MITNFTPAVRWVILVNDRDVPELTVTPAETGYICSMCCRSFDQIERNRQRVIDYLQKNRPDSVVMLPVAIRTK